MLAPPVTRLTTHFTLLLSGVLAFAPVQVTAAPPKDPEPAPAEDEPPDDPNYERAVEAYRRGTELYNAAKFEEALEAFQEAATLYASADFQFNIAKCYERLNLYEEAIRHYEIYLRTSEDGGDRAVIEASIADLERRIAERDAAADKDPDPDPQPQPDDKPKKNGRILIAVGGALLGGGAVFAIAGGLANGIPASGKNKELGDVLGSNPDGLTFAEADALADETRKLQTLMIVNVAIGSAIGITGAALLGAGLAKKKKAAATARLQVAPTWGRSGVGLTLSGRF